MNHLKLYTFITLIISANVVLSADIRVNISGIDEPEGVIRVALFPENKTDQFPVPVDVSRLASEAKKDGVSVVFKNVDNGVYAISVLHDANNNNEMDKFFGIPSEPYGNSGEYTSFKPSYEDSKFEVANKDLIIEIEVH